jgi:hypothetical protein
VPRCGWTREVEATTPDEKEKKGSEEEEIRGREKRTFHRASLSSKAGNEYFIGQSVTSKFAKNQSVFQQIILFSVSAAEGGHFSCPGASFALIV